MKGKRIFAVLMSALIIVSAFAGCSGDSSQTTSVTSESSKTTTSSSSSSESSKTVKAESVNANFTARDMDVGYEETDSVKISCSGSEFSISGSGATAKDGVLTINKEGTYVLSGSIDEGRIVVNVTDSEKVQLVLNGFTIKCTTHSPIFIKSADKVFITIKDGTKNIITDGTSYTDLADDESNVDAAIFSRADMTINGSGSLTVNGNMKNGIVSKDDLVITGGTITVNAKNNGICGKDCVKIADGNITIKSEGDGIKSNNSEDTSKGYIYICGGKINITSTTDVIQAETTLTIEKGEINLKIGGGSENSSKTSGGKDNPQWGRWGQEDSSTTEEDTASAKGLKAGGDIKISNATITADTSDDSIHSNSNVTIESGTLNLKSGDDGIHADTSTVINNGNIVIEKSYEGIEGSNVTINGGTIELTASDDGINSAGGSDSSSMGGRIGQNSFTENSNIYIKITGGKVTVDASGDGLDSNSNLIIEGGEIYVNGPTNDGDGALDYDGTATISGGTFVAVGSSGMVQGFSDSSTQCSILYNLSSSHSAGEKITLADSSGNEILSYTATKQFSSVVVSSAKITKSGAYKLTVGSESYDIEMSSTVYSNGSNGFGGGGMRGNKPNGFGRGNNGNPPDGNPPQMPNGENSGMTPPDRPNEEISSTNT
mgnify:CR=1 FL=1|jgi:hypothetical protein